MPGTRVHQLRSATTTDSGSVYAITVSCTLPGTLPDAALFLLQTVTQTDPKDDTLVRICGPADFATYGTDRDYAMRQRGYYRASIFTLKFSDVAQANDAWKELSARINALVIDYDVFLTSFLTQDEGVDTSYPTVDASERTARVNAYKARVAAVATAESARDDHQRSCNDAKSLELATVQRELATAQSDLTAARSIRSVVDVLAASYPVPVAAITTAITGALNTLSTSSATAGQQLAISTQLTAARDASDTIGGYNLRLVAEVQTPIAALVGTLEARVSDLTQRVSSAQSELAACDAEMSRLQGDVDEARRARDAALAAVREICTDFTPPDTSDGTLAAALSLLLGGV